MERRLFVSQFKTSTIQTAEYNDMDNEWELILVFLQHLRASVLTADQLCTLYSSVPWLPSLLLVKSVSGSAPSNPSKRWGHCVGLRRTGELQSVTSHDSVFSLSANPQSQICCLYCSEPWQCVDPLGCGIAHSGSSMFAASQHC